MALGTAPHQDNPQMHAPGTPGATPHSTEPRDASQPWLDPDDDKVDWVMLMRCYPHAKSKDDLRAAAMKAGAEVAQAAEAAIASKDVPMSEQLGEPGRTPPPPPAPPARQAAERHAPAHEPKPRD
jgi:hypothetical protein